MYKSKDGQSRNINGRFKPVTEICSKYNVSYVYALKFARECDSLVKIGRLSRVDDEKFEKAFLAYTVR